MIPPLSPYGLIQESLWPDEWRILVSCMLLNCTTRKQVDKIINQLFTAYPTAQHMSVADPSDVSRIVSCLGFGNRRARNLIKMSQSYVSKTWSHAAELPGIGEYASVAWEMFVKGDIPEASPKDHALTLYYEWMTKRSET
jgi:methyl-CpG-binding domain protein 4